MACTARIEKTLARSGYRLVAGTDEVGRGAMAGPVVAAAVILDLSDVPEGIDDSKKLRPAQRAELAVEIRKRARAFAVARVEHDRIDQINIHRASLTAIAESVKALQPPADYVLIDGSFGVPTLNCPQRTIVKGDGLSVSIAAASILAKVARDEWMIEYDLQYPGYGFASHVGYCTRFHREAVERLGPSAIHRMTWQGVGFLQGSLDLRIEDKSPS